MVKALCIFAIVLAPLMTGCESAAEHAADRAVRDYIIGDYNRARAELLPISNKTDENFVLNNCRLGSAALAVSNVQEAQNAFQKAYEVMNSVGVNNGGRTLGATLVDEKIRVWKGEPFDRAMTNFYLGLTYYMQQDYNNARAAFENSLFKLKDYADANDADKYRQVESDFALGELMLAKCWQRLGREDPARQAFQKLATQRPEYAALCDYDWNLHSNLLLVVDFGFGPRKVTDFDGSIVGFGPTPWQAGGIPPPTVALNNSPVSLGALPVPTVDLLQLAQDRRWESIDTIRVVKSAIGTGLIGAGAYEGLRSHNRGNMEAGAAMVAAGLVLKATSQADMRHWEMLPRTVFILPLRVEPGTYEVSVTFPYPGMAKTYRNLPVPPQGEATYYYRMERYSPAPINWPPDQTLPPVKK